MHGLNYLGYGIIDRGITRRPYLMNNGIFITRMTVKNNVSPQLSKFLPLTLKALGLFGAAGARARKGFGSLSLESLRYNGEEKWSVPANVEELRRSISNLLAEMGVSRHNTDRLPDYTAFSSQAVIKIVRTGRDPLQLLDEVGKELLRYRSYGNKNILPWGEEAEQNFAVDHDLMLNLINGQTNRVTGHPRRVVFGLPHNYFFLSIKKKASVDAANHKRRAGPLFIHLHALSSEEFAAVLSLLPARFLPEGESIKMSGDGHNARALCSVNYREIENFLSRPAFNHGVVVWP